MFNRWEFLRNNQHSSCYKQKHKIKERSKEHKRNCPGMTGSMQEISPGTWVKGPPTPAAQIGAGRDAEEDSEAESHKVELGK